MLTDRETLKRAKALRRPLTDAERILWSRLKERALGGYYFRVQHPYGRYILDFACVRSRLVVEVDGATHATPAQRAHDERRTKFLEANGWRVIRFWNDDVYRNLHGVLDGILAALKRPRRP